MKKVMQHRYMFVGTLEEVEHNTYVSRARCLELTHDAPLMGQFAGRNWNYGQSIELVLRRPSGHFLP